MRSDFSLNTMGQFLCAPPTPTIRYSFFVLTCAMQILQYFFLVVANPAVNTPRPSRGTRIESCDFIVLIGDP